MAVDKTEHYEVWYTTPAGEERHQKADTEAQAVEIATDHTWNGFDNVTVQKITTSITTSVVDIDIPPKPDAEPVPESA